MYAYTNATHAYTDSYRHCHCYCYCYGDCLTYADGEAECDTEAAPHTCTAPRVASIVLENDDHEAKPHGSAITITTYLMVVLFHRREHCCRKRDQLVGFDRPGPIGVC